MQGDCLRSSEFDGILWFGISGIVFGGIGVDGFELNLDLRRIRLPFIKWYPKMTVLRH